MAMVTPASGSYKFVEFLIGNGRLFYLVSRRTIKPFELTCAIKIVSEPIAPLRPIDEDSNPQSKKGETKSTVAQSDRVTFIGCGSKKAFAFNRFST
jgi:hypothetical protein